MSASTPATPLRLGMIGGGNDAFIGGVHRLACQLDNSFVLTAGALSSAPEKSLASAHTLGLAPDRSYRTWQEMLDRERHRPEPDRIDAVTIVTPNHTHATIAAAFVEAGIPVVCDKPLTSTLADARALAATVGKHGTPFCVTYNYTGYPMVRHAAHLIRTGAIGTIRKCFVEYHQGWLATKLEDSGQKQASWRNDPAQAGGGGAIGDIGSHAENLLTTVTGLHVEQVAADLTSFVPGRVLDDDAAVFMKLSGGHGAKATLTVCQVAIGEENNLTLRIHGDKGSLWWRQEEPNHLTIATLDGPTTTLARGSGFKSPADSASRLPPGHPEGFIEAFANIYKGFAQTVRCYNEGKPLPTSEHPSIHDGLRGVQFIDAAVRSSKANSAWTTV